MNMSKSRKVGLVGHIERIGEMRMSIKLQSVTMKLTDYLEKASTDGTIMLK
jgi:hypothetical protein